jgi:hypothetical protein
MTPEQISELRRLRDDAQGGDWLVHGNAIHSGIECVVMADSMNPKRYANVALVAAMFHALPDLLAAAEREAKLKEVSTRCLTYLADLNGCPWIPGVTAGEIDMRQRAKSLQEQLYTALEETP